ncbi:MAG TPA: nuclear transport factor 2 family protein [Bellilinea sp.]|nr:nuclear transport factor 2 family protein [Bellilinea sp.]
MTNIIIGKDCGNSPKNVLLEHLTAAFAKNDTALLLSRVTEDIVWDIVGSETVSGKTAFAAALEKLNSAEAIELTIEHVSSHGRAGAVDGVRKMADGNTFAYCHIYVFSSVKYTHIKEITSFVIRID